MACCSSKAAISLKRLKIEEKLLWKAYRNSSTVFRMVPSPTPFPKIGGSQPQPKTAIAIISGTGKATDCKLAGTFTGSIRTEAHKNWQKTERGRIQGLPKFSVYPLLSQERVKLRISNLAGTFTGSIRTKSHYEFWRKRAWAYPRTGQIF